METMPAVPVAPSRSLYSVGMVRDFFFPLVALVAAATLPFQWIAYAFVVVGHAHFLMAYRYQQKAGKMNLRYLLTALLLIAAAVLYFVLDGSVVPILVAAGILFAFHFALDEFTLHNEELTTKSIVTGLGFALLFSALIAVVAFPQLKFLGVVASIVVAVGIVVRLYMSKHDISPAELYLWIVEGVLCILAVGLDFPERVIGVVLLLHFANWYFGYVGKVKGSGARASEYWITFVITLIIPIVLFVAWIQFHPPFLTFFFGLAFYYAWAIAHIVLSFVAMRPIRM